MSRRNPMGYKGYQGRGGGSSGWLKAVVYILAILVVGTGGYLLAKQGDISLPSLPSIQIQLPQSTQTPEENPAATTDPEGSTSQAPEPTPSPTPTPAVTEIRAVEVTVAQLLDGSAQRRVEQAGCDALVVEVKGEEGMLQWPSQVPTAQQWKAVASQKSLTDALKTLSQQGIYLVARMDCFRDQLLAGINPDDSLLLSQRGRRWYDFWGDSWVSPVSQTVRDYMVDLCVELSQMGFDELVLNGAYYPDEGEVYALAQSEMYPADRTASVSTFWKELHEALKDSDVMLSVQVRGESVVDAGSSTGMTPQMMQEYAQRVWVTAESVNPSQVTTALTQVGMDGDGQVMVQSSSNGQTVWE